jgi:integrase
MRRIGERAGTRTQDLLIKSLMPWGDIPRQVSASKPQKHRVVPCYFVYYLALSPTRGNSARQPILLPLVTPGENQMAKGLTALAVKNEKPQAARVEKPDGGCAGLYLVVQPSGAKSWAVRYRHAGKPRKLTLGPCYVAEVGEPEPVAPAVGQPLTLAGARKLAMHALHQVEKGIDPAADKRRSAAVAVDRAAQRKRDTVEALADLFMERYAKKQMREASWRETARIFETIIKPAWKGRTVHDVTRRDVISLLDGIVDRGAPILANRVLAVVRKWFNWLASRDVISVSPCVGVPPPSAETKRDRVLLDDEMRWFWAACDKVAWPFGPLAQMLLLTGQRRDEVGEMRWSEVDFDAKLWTIPRQRMKGGSEHAVPLSDAAIKILKSLPRIVGAKGFIFSTTGKTPVGGYSRAKDRIDAAMEKARRKAAGLPEDDAEYRKVRNISANKKLPVEIAPWRFHDLRRSTASGIARLRIALPVIEKVLGHSSGSFAGVVGVYQLYNFADEKRSALQDWAHFVEGIVSGKRAEQVIAEIIAGRDASRAGSPYRPLRAPSGGGYGPRT